MRAAAVFVGMLILSEVLFGQVAEKTSATRNETEPFDIVIVNGHIIDGTGSPWYSGQVGIRAGHIAAIGNLEASPDDRRPWRRRSAGLYRHARPV